MYLGFVVPALGSAVWSGTVELISEDESSAHSSVSVLPEEAQFSQARTISQKMCRSAYALCALHS